MPGHSASILTAHWGKRVFETRTGEPVPGNPSTQHNGGIVMRQQACAKGGRSTAARFIVAGAIIGLILASAEAGYGQLTEGPLSPAAVVDDSSFGGAGWFPASNAIASDDLYALAAPGMSPTHYLKATTFGFAIPAPAQIQGIEVFV